MINKDSQVSQSYSGEVAHSLINAKNHLSMNNSNHNNNSNNKIRHGFNKIIDSQDV